MENAPTDVKVSVVVPVYNVARHLGNCFACLAAQTLEEREIVCVDDGSTDDSLAVLQHYAAQDARIVVLHQENAGVSAARNAGMLCARGKYVSFYDPDDTIAPDMLEKLYSMAEKRGVPFALAAYLTYTPDSKERRFCPPFFYGLQAENHMKVTPWMMVNSIPFSVVNLYNRNFLVEKGIRFARLRVSEDVVFNLNVWLNADYFAATAEPLYHYVRHEDSVMGTFSRKPFPVCLYLKYYFEVGRLFRRPWLKKIPGLGGKAAAVYVIMLREKGAAVTYKHYDPVHDYAWVCRANRCLRGRLWRQANKALVLLYLARIAVFKLTHVFSGRG